MELKKNGTRKLTLEQVNKMKGLYAEGYTQGSLAKYFGVSIGQVGRIVRGESWAKQADERMMTQAEMDMSADRMLAFVEKVNAGVIPLKAPEEKYVGPFEEGGAWKEYSKRVEEGRMPPVNPMEEE